MLLPISIDGYKGRSNRRRPVKKRLLAHTATPPRSKRSIGAGSEEFKMEMMQIKVVMTPNSESKTHNDAEAEDGQCHAVAAPVVVSLGLRSTPSNAALQLVEPIESEPRPTCAPCSSSGSGATGRRRQEWGPLHCIPAAGACCPCQISHIQHDDAIRNETPPETMCLQGCRVGTCAPATTGSNLAEAGDTRFPLAEAYSRQHTVDVTQ